MNVADLTLVDTSTHYGAFIPWHMLCTKRNVDWVWMSVVACCLQSSTCGDTS